MHRYVVVATLLLISANALADDFFGAVETTPVENPTTDNPWSQRAWLQHKIGYGYRTPAVGVSRDSADLTRTETEFYGEISWRRANWRLQLAGSLTHDWLPGLADERLWSGYAFTPAQRDARTWRWEGSDSYVSWQHDDWWLKGGYQTLAWGEAESLRITDVLARRDQRWPGQEDLEELRLPVPAILVNWRNTLDLVLLPTMPTDRQPVPFDEFDPYIALANRETLHSPQVITRRRDLPGWALRWQSRGAGMDAQVILADLYSFETTPTSRLFTDGDATRLAQLTVEPWRQHIVGLSIQAAHGSWLLKTEQAWHRGTHLPQHNRMQPWREHEQWRGAVIAEHNGINNLTVTGEFSWRYVHRHRPELADDQWQSAQALRVSYRMFHQRLVLNGLAMHLLGSEGTLLRMAADWSISDQLSLSMSLVEYSATRPAQLLHDYRHNDTVLLALRWGLF